MQRLLVFLLLSVCVPAYGMKIYNIAYDNENDLNHPGMLQDATFKNQPQTLVELYIFDADKLDNTLDTIPLNEFVMFNVESGVPNCIGCILLDYESNPATAISIRKNIVDHIASERPDLDTCLYTLPGNANDAYKGAGKEFKAWTKREEDFKQVTVNMTSMCVGGAWSYTDSPAIDWQLKSWRSKMLAQISLTVLVHGKKPKLVLSNRVKNDLAGPLTPYSVFDYQLAFAQEYGIEVVYWTNRKDGDHSLTWWPLFVYGQLP